MMTLQKLKSTNHESRRPIVIAAIPCFNEERFIGSVVIKAKKYVDRVIVIDDGSTDATAEVASDAGVVVYRHSRNLGYGAAIRSALQKVKELGADVMVTLDGDGQHEPADIPQLLSPILNGEADVVVGSRFLGQAEKPPFYRRLGQRVLTIATNLGSRQMVSDSQSGFRAYSSQAIKAINLTESGMSVSSEILLAISKSGLRVAEVPIHVSYADKAKRNPVAHGVSVLSRILTLFSLRQPLLLFGVPGLALLAGGLALGILVLAKYNETGTLATGHAIGMLLLCLTGLLALFTALMLQSLKELLRREWKQFQEAEKPTYESEEDNSKS